MIEEEIAKRYKEQNMRCPVHLSVGQEAAAVGVCANLTSQDKMVSTHRGHAHYIAKGGSLKGLIGELYGKQSGCSRGNGGSMHLIDLSCGFYGSTSIVGGTIPVGVGLSFADRLKKSDAKTVVCLGDAAIEEGVFHEAANFASLHKLNVLFVLEDNKYSCYTHKSQRQPIRSFKKIAEAHSLFYRRTDIDVEDIKEKTALSLQNLPALLVIPTWRHLQHCGPDNDDSLGYRELAMINFWLKHDWSKKLWHFEDIDAQKITKEIDEAFSSALSAPFPDLSEMGKYTYANP
jgi:pyruvate dehydrogenase E1 component alpha subunit